jgi:hypothetical protein
MVALSVVQWAVWMAEQTAGTLERPRVARSAEMKAVYWAARWAYE